MLNDSNQYIMGISLDNTIDHLTLVKISLNNILMIIKDH